MPDLVAITIIALQILILIFQIQTRMEVKRLETITKEELLGLLGIVRRLLKTSADDKAAIEALKAEVADSAFLRDPEVNAEFDAVVAEAAAATPAE